jgi:hypothetical protein
VNLELATGKNLASADEHWMMFTKFTLNVLQSLFVSRMNRLIGQECDEGYFLGRRSYLQSGQSLASGSVREEDKIALLGMGNRRN